MRIGQNIKQQYTIEMVSFATQNEQRIQAAQYSLFGECLSDKIIPLSAIVLLCYRLSLHLPLCHISRGQR